MRMVTLEDNKVDRDDVFAEGWMRDERGMAFIICLMGFLGGLVMSAIKRDRGVKDWGQMIEGHGGMLDRLDSVCYGPRLACAGLGDRLLPGARHQRLNQNHHSTSITKPTSSQRAGPSTSRNEVGAKPDQSCACTLRSSMLRAFTRPRNTETLRSSLKLVGGAAAVTVNASPALASAWANPGSTFSVVLRKRKNTAPPRRQA